MDVWQKRFVTFFSFSIPPPAMTAQNSENIKKPASRSRSENPDEMAEKISGVIDVEDQEINPALEIIFEEKDLVDRLRHLPIWLLSLAVHIAIFVVLATHYLADKNQSQVEIISQPGDEVGVDMDDLDSDELEIASFDIETYEDRPVPVDTPLETVDFQVTDVPLTETFDFSAEASTALIEPVNSAAVGRLAGRMEGKATLLRSGGGNDESEKAVERALDWFARHQLPDGGWSLRAEDNSSCKCSGMGRKDARIGATALAILPFLGAGHTMTKGKYHKVVARGINYLLNTGVRTENGFDLSEKGGVLYSHGLAAIVLCEAYAMSDEGERAKNKILGKAAQEAIRFVEYAQDPAEGGWRYVPKERGDTSVVGWQLMALKSAEFGNLTVKPTVLRKALNFLVNQVSYDNQSRYGYQGAQGGSDALTSIGLLCRLFLDWKTNQPSLLKGTDYLSSKGPDFTNPYYIYYGTQLFHHVGGPQWKNWNNQVRDHLVQMQVKEGEMSGSWTPSSEKFSEESGRHYVTAMLCMTLEVYYRHMPLYQLQQKGGNEEELFPID